MLDKKLTIKSVIDDTVKARLLNVKPGDEVGKRRVIKQVHKIAPGSLAIRCYLQSLKER